MTCCCAQAHHSVVQLDIGISCVLLSSRVQPKKSSLLQKKISPDSDSTFIINKPYLLPSTRSVPGKRKKKKPSEDRIFLLERTRARIFRADCFESLHLYALCKKSHDCTEKLHFFTCNNEKPPPLGSTAWTCFPIQFCPASIDLSEDKSKSVKELSPHNGPHKTCIFQSYANPWNSKWNIIENKPNTF